jgi:hypothetical protein
MGAPAEIRPWRRGAAALAGSGVGLWLAIRGIIDAGHGWADWTVFGAAAVATTGALLFLRRDVWAQVLARGVAYFFFVPFTATVALELVYGGHFEGWIAAIAAAAGGSLLLARPALHTPQAHAQFAPVAMRRTFLAAAVASATAAVTAGAVAVGAALWSSWAVAALFVALGGAMAASAWGVVRMRAWGVLLGGLTSVVTVGAAAVAPGVPWWLMVLAAAPGATLVLTVLLARLRSGGQAPTIPARTRAAEIRFRVATSDADEPEVEPSIEAARAQTSV